MAREAVDGRPWIRLDQGFPDNPKVIGLSAEAFRLHVTLICWCARNKTNGKIKYAVMKAMSTKARRDELLAAGLVEDNGETYEIHDYLLHQDSAEQVAAYTKARRSDGTYGAHVKHHVNGKKPSASCEHCIAEGRADAA